MAQIPRELNTKEANPTILVLVLENPRIANPNSSGKGEAMIIPESNTKNQRKRGMRNVLLESILI